MLLFRSGRPWGQKESTRKSANGISSCLACGSLPETGEYLADFSEVMHDHAVKEQELNDVYNKFEQSQQRPWTKAEFPLVAELLEKNEKPLRMIIDGVRRSRFYSPIVAADNGPLAHTELIIGFSEVREVSKELSARAMLQLGSGDLSVLGRRFWPSDALACWMRSDHSSLIA